MPGLAAAVIALNSVLAVVVGGIVLGYEEMRLRVDWDVDPALLAARVPGLILQPLVENAVGHGLAPRAGGGRIAVSTTLDQDSLCIEVVDDGVGLSDGGERLIGRPRRRGTAPARARQRPARRTTRDGDLLAAAYRLLILESAVIRGGVAAAAGTLEIEGTIEKDLVSARSSSSPSGRSW